MKISATLLDARDRMGEKPLHHLRGDDERVKPHAGKGRARRAKLDPYAGEIGFRLRRAVETEQFELAASIRDKIRGLE